MHRVSYYSPGARLQVSGPELGAFAEAGFLALKGSIPRTARDRLAHGWGEQFVAPYSKQIDLQISIYLVMFCLPLSSHPIILGPIQ